MKRKSSESDPERPTTSGVTGIPTQGTTNMAHEKSQKKVGKRPGRKPSKIDQKAKLERSRQSARECRARKKLRYQYLEELVSSREKAVFSLREEVEMYKRWSIDLDRGIIPDGLLKLLEHETRQESLKVQTSPQSQNSTPAASPLSSADTDRSGSQQYGSVTSQPLGSHLSQPPGQILGQTAGQPRRQQLVKQPTMNQPTVQALSSLNRGSRSFEESSQSCSSSPLMYRSGSVPNLTTSSSQNVQQPQGLNSSSATGSNNFVSLVYKDLGVQDNTTLTSSGFVPAMDSFTTPSTDSQQTGNIPNIVSHRSPPLSSTNQSNAAWPWASSKQFSGASHGSQLRTYPVTCANSVPKTGHSSHPVAAQSLLNMDYSTSYGASFPVSSETSSFSGGVVASSAVPYCQRPRSSSDLTGKVTSLAVPATLTSSSSQQHLPGLYDPAVTSFTTHNMFSTLSDSVPNFLTHTSASRDSLSVCVGSDLSASLSAVQVSTPVCAGSELSASISEPIPHWYSFLDDLESAATFSARQGAFSDCGTPGSTRTRSGPATPSSVDSPYSQHLTQQQQPQQQQQVASGNDGNIPNIISDMLGHEGPS